MGDRIKITTDELRSQGQQLASLADEYEALYNKANASIKKMKNASSAKLAANLTVKIGNLSLYFTSLRETLRKGSNVANQCAESYENTDRKLRELYGDSFSDEVKNSAVSNQIVEPSFNEKVDRLKNTEGFQQGNYWGNNSHYKGYYKGYYVDAWSCCAKAKQMQIEVTGKLGDYTGITDAKQIQPGDVIHYYYPGTYWFQGKEYPNEHWVFVTAVNGNTISVGEGNAWDGQNNERVNYRDMDISQFNNIESIYR